MKKQQWVKALVLVVIVLVPAFYYVAIPAFVRSQTSQGTNTFFVSGHEPFKGAESCKTCHPRHYEQWSQSLHAKAYTSVDFAQRAEDLSWGMPTEQCIFCHAPLAAQGVPMQESITCEVCHGPGLTQAVVPDVCKGCHGQPLGQPEPEPSAIMQSTPLEFEHSVAKRDGRMCPDCHMPKEDGVSFHGSKGSRVAPESYKGVVRIEGIERRDSQIAVKIKNNVTGHWLPTGAATNVIFLEVLGYDAKGQVIYQNDHRFEKSVFTFRKMPMAVTGDTRLKDNEIREVTFDAPMSVVRMSAALKIKPRLLSGEATEFVIDRRETAIGLAG